LRRLRRLRRLRKMLEDRGSRIYFENRILNRI